MRDDSEGISERSLGDGLPIFELRLLTWTTLSSPPMLDLTLLVCVLVWFAKNVITCCTSSSRSSYLSLSGTGFRFFSCSG